MGRGVGDVFLHLFHRVAVDQRALRHAVGEAVADLHGVDLGHQALGDFLVDAGLHVDAVGAHAGLAGIAVLRGQDAVDRAVQVGVVEHDEGRVAAQFQRQLLDGGRALLHQRAADFGRPREAQLAHDIAFAQRGADIARAAGDDVEHARGHAGFFSQHGQRQRGQRRLLGRLDHHGAAGGQRRTDLAGDHGGGEVPGRDRGGDADGLLERQQALPGLGALQNVAVDALGLFGEPFQERRGVGDLARGLGDRLALFGRHDGGQVLLVLHHELGPLQQDRGAFLAGLGAPGGQRGLSAGDGLFRFLAAQLRHGHDGLAGGGVVDGDGGAAAGAYPLAVDVARIAQQIGTREGMGQCCHVVSLLDGCGRPSETGVAGTGLGSKPECLLRPRSLRLSAG
ncbi:hypothetical protein D3C87_656840 [compost metagenome]